MQFVDDFFIFIQMREDVPIEIPFIFVHVCSYFVHRELYRVLYFFEILYFLYLVVWKLVLGGAEDTFIAE